MHRARKRFGQHFLHDQEVIHFIIAQMDPRDPTPVIEIGPGKGALTAPLLTRLGKLSVIELDRDLVSQLSSRQTDSGLCIIQADALDFDYRRFAAGDRIRLVGNLPYNISTPLLFHLLAQVECIASMLFMLQQEVVERICATPGSHTYGRLSVMIQSCCRAEQLLTIGPESFTPPPKVRSSIIRLTPEAVLRDTIEDLPSFNEVVRRAFSKRRKTLRNALKELEPSQILEDSGIDPGLRAERLSVTEYIHLANLLFRSRRALDPVDNIVGKTKLEA